MVCCIPEDTVVDMRKEGSPVKPEQRMVELNFDNLLGADAPKLDRIQPLNLDWLANIQNIQGPA